MEKKNKGSEQDETNLTVASIDMCFYCFDTLISYLERTAPPEKPKFTDEAFPLFVTWTIGKEKDLRGCIGTFDRIHLHQGLKQYAIKSAIKDTRFSPISRSEIKNLNVSVSILTQFEQAADYLDWQVGTHGIKITLSEDISATYLPEVAKEHGWNKIQTVDSLLRKAGYEGAIDDKIRKILHVTRYRSEKLTASFQDYLARTHRNPV